MSALVARLLIGLGIVLLLVAGIFLAQGAPAPPAIQLQTTLTPNVAQQITLTFYTSVYSTQAINSIDLQGVYVIYTVWQNGNLVIANQQHAVNIIGSNGLQTNLATTITVNLPAAPAYTVENVTVSAYTVNPSWTTGTFTSPTTTTSFNGASPTIPTVPSAPFSNFAFALLGYITIGAAFIALGALLMAAPLSGVLAFIVLWIVTGIEYISFVVFHLAH